jgi:hypothetical protein
LIRARERKGGEREAIEKEFFLFESFSRSQRLNTVGAKNFSEEYAERNRGSRWKKKRKTKEREGEKFKGVEIRTKEAESTYRTFQGKSRGGIKLEGLK